LKLRAAREPAVTVSLSQKAFAVVSVTPPFTVMDIINFPPSKPKQAHDSIMRAIAYGGEAA